MYSFVRAVFYKDERRGHPDREETIVDFVYIIGWLGVGFGLMVAPPQLIKIIKTGKTSGISLLTYIALCAALLCYLLYAISIKDAVFMTAQSINLVTNSVILFLLIRNKVKGV